MLKDLLAASPVTLDALNRPIPSAPASAAEVMSSLLVPPLTPSAPAPTLHTLDEVARQLRVCPKTIQRRIKAGLIRKAPLGGRLVRIASEELRRLLAGLPQ